MLTKISYLETTNASAAMGARKDQIALEFATLHYMNLDKVH